ncbi:hypothetical protein M9H77_13281 [Catharanthus roseus]|uniref:Uncharacterized protein n=1 Tax=Catharanthus roseus TaxID=4058 RepID=A0ACC0BJZ5_CATRO|nr:hypothetical protein M9H77_13281 [Catharanthus roseus]
MEEMKKLNNLVSMEGEINNFILVWSSVFISLCYCHSIDKLFPKGIMRALFILPVAFLFFLLPLKLTTIHLGGTTSFFIGWLASFKLILFSLGKGPLASKPPLPIWHFIPLAALPIKAPQDQKITKKCLKSPLNYVTKFFLLLLCIRMYQFTHFLHPKILYFFYAIHIYFALDMLLAFVGAVARAIVRVELEPQFEEPYLSTSVQDFWGRRWNLMVSKILRPTIYIPTRSTFARFLGWRWAALPAVFTTFLVSGLMHEVVFYTFGRVKPTGVVTSFFVVQGTCLCVEIIIKRMAYGKFRLPGIVSGALALTFVFFTGMWLFFPPFLQAQADLKACTESLAFIESVKKRRLVSPNDITCPYF